MKLQRALAWLGRRISAALTVVRHPLASTGWLILNRTKINYEAEVNADANSIIIACVRWVQRVFSEAPPVLEKWVPERQEWEIHQRDAFLDLLNRPNNFYGGIALIKATAADMMVNGEAYWLKVRSATGRVVQLWWAPSEMLTPIGDLTDPTVFIHHYDYSPGGVSAIPVRVEDVVHFRDGIDSENPRKGRSPVKSLYREIFTDDEAANMTASLLRNMGVPGVIISPKAGNIGPTAGESIKTKFMEKFTGDHRGEPMVMEGSTEIQQFGFSPEQMQLRSLRGIPEERISAVLGVNAAVVGLGAGLATTKVGATLREYREEAFESTIIPMYREIAEELTHQLLADFHILREWRVAFDLSKVRVLQEDEDKRAERLNKMLESGGITVAEYRRAMGYVALPEHEVYLRRVGMRAVPTGTTPEEQAEAGNPAPAAPATPSMPAPGERELRLRRDAERLEAALSSRLSEPGADLRDVLAAHYLLAVETTCETLGVPLPNDAGPRAIAEGHTMAELGMMDVAVETRARQWTQRAQAFALNLLEAGVGG